MNSASAAGPGAILGSGSLPPPPVFRAHQLLLSQKAMCYRCERINSPLWLIFMGMQGDSWNLKDLLEPHRVLPIILEM
ncbi:hypothetical protein VULLAG_LOCUS4997 [Vulpes lagopus]